MAGLCSDEKSHEFDWIRGSELMRIATCQNTMIVSKMNRDDGVRNAAMEEVPIHLNSIILSAQAK